MFGLFAVNFGRRSGVQEMLGRHRVRELEAERLRKGRGRPETQKW